LYLITNIEVSIYLSIKSVLRKRFICEKKCIEKCQVSKLEEYSHSKLYLVFEWELALNKKKILIIKFQLLIQIN